MCVYVFWQCKNVVCIVYKSLCQTWWKRVYVCACMYVCVKNNCISMLLSQTVKRCDSTYVRSISLCLFLTLSVWPQCGRKEILPLYYIFPHTYRTKGYNLKLKQVTKPQTCTSALWQEKKQHDVNKWHHRGNAALDLAFETKWLN